MRTPMQTTTGAVAVAVLCGCTSSATLHMRDGREVEGRILRSSGESVWVEGRNDQPLELRREDIVDVTHPGNWEIGVGTGLLAASAGLFMTGVAICGGLLDDCSEPHRGEAVFPFLGALVLAVPGLVLEIDGIATHMGSRFRYTPEAPR